MNFEGILIQKIQEREGESANGPWKVATYLLATESTFPKRMTVDVSNGMSERIKSWDDLIGKRVRIAFDIDAREWQGKWFNAIKAWNIEEVIEVPVEQKTPEQIAEENFPFKEPTKLI